MRPQLTLLPDAFDDQPATERLHANVAGARAIAADDPLKPGIRIVQVAVFECCQCQRPIRREFILGTVTPERAFPGEPLKRLVRGYCDFCDLLYEVTTQLSGGVWQQADEGQVVRDERIKRAHVRHVTRILNSMGYGPAA